MDPQVPFPRTRVTAAAFTTKRKHAPITARRVFGGVKDGGGKPRVAGPLIRSGGLVAQRCLEVPESD
ncbi:hypothetical protein GCM10010171_61090 [Actinokineospora fastidiosa]|uniref:Uncharacterized protein n=1 Tax=Actinokineospora fastidiosa TaxID=1816 RepID=A0A918LJA8_9PSEU|nr:hypothetical protein GCM10010171_61090 [Actinokineospora fastidiosa]